MYHMRVWCIIIIGNALDFFRNENITIGFICLIHSECKAVNML